MSSWWRLLKTERGASENGTSREREVDEGTPHHAFRRIISTSHELQPAGSPPNYRCLKFQQIISLRGYLRFASHRNYDNFFPPYRLSILGTTHHPTLSPFFFHPRFRISEVPDACVGYMYQGPMLPQMIRSSVPISPWCIKAHQVFFHKTC
jgi:hypothetical protein